MKKLYKKPQLEDSFLLNDTFLESFSRPKIGEVDDPSVGQTKYRNAYSEIDDEEFEIINILKEIDDNDTPNQLW